MGFTCAVSIIRPSGRCPVGAYHRASATPAAVSPVHRTRIKICGLTREEDVRAAVAAGADAIGFVFYPPSPRYVSFERAELAVSCRPS
jgi:hypothetical protein